MEEENKDSDNIYIYTEEDDDNDSPLDQSGPNYAQTQEETLAKKYNSISINESEVVKSGVSIFGLLLKTMFNPIEGWKSVRRSKITPEMAQKECFYPLLAIYAISKFAILAYSARADLSEVVVDAVTSFVSFFFGYFCIVILLKHIMPNGVAQVFDTNFGKNLVIFSLSSLCLFFIFTELLPMLWAVLIFLPLWTVYMICRATRFLKIPHDRRLITTALINLIIIGMPILLEWGLGEILPN